MEPSIREARCHGSLIRSFQPVGNDGAVLVEVRLLERTTPDVTAAIHARLDEFCAEMANVVGKGSGCQRLAALSPAKPADASRDDSQDEA